MKAGPQTASGGERRLAQGGRVLGDWGLACGPQRDESPGGGRADCGDWENVPARRLCAERPSCGEGKPLDSTSQLLSTCGPLGLALSPGLPPSGCTGPALARLP